MSQMVGPIKRKDNVSRKQDQDFDAYYECAHDREFDEYRSSNDAEVLVRALQASKLSAETQNAG